MSERTDWQWWHDAWETHMAGYLPERESVQRLLCEVLVRTVGQAPTIVELGSGTGSLAHRIATALPDATVIAVDLDPVLATIGQQVLGDADGRLQRRQLDLRDHTWHDPLPTPVDAVVSMATFHVLGADDTRRILTDLAGVLRPGGVLLDLDWAAAGIDDPRLATSVRALTDERNGAAAPTAFPNHRRRLEADPELARLDELRQQRFGPSPATEPDHLDADGHRRTLLEAGFAEVVELWRHLDLALLSAVR